MYLPLGNPPPKASFKPTLPKGILKFISCLMSEPNLIAFAPNFLLISFISFFISAILYRLSYFASKYDFPYPGTAFKL